MPADRQSLARRITDAGSILRSGVEIQSAANNLQSEKRFRGPAMFLVRLSLAGHRAVAPTNQFPRGCSELMIYGRKYQITIDQPNVSPKN